MKRATSEDGTGSESAFSLTDGSPSKAGRPSVEDYMRILAFLVIVSRKHYGAHERFARKLLSELAKSTLPSADYFVLKRHMAVVDEILKFNENDVLTCPRSALDDGLRALRGIITEWPSSRQDELMKRRMADLAPVDANTSDAAISDMFEALTPWPLPGVPIVDFDPLLPTLHSIDGSSLEKSRKFEQLMLSKILVPMLSIGTKIQATIVKVCKAAMQRFAKKPDDLDGHILGMLLQFMRCFRALISLCDAEEIRYLDDAYQLVGLTKKTPSAKYTPMDVIASIIHGVPCWKTVADDLRRTYDATKSGASEYNAMMRQLDMCVQGETILSCQQAEGIVLQFRNLRGSVREQLSEKGSQQDM